jgi:hypothetical protein
MPTDDLWITARISDAQASHPSVTDAVSARLHELLKGPFSEGHITQTDLRTVANTLLKGMVPSSPTAEAKP